jgi:hypothetical protein
MVYRQKERSRRATTIHIRYKNGGLVFERDGKLRLRKLTEN